MKREGNFIRPVAHQYCFHLTSRLIAPVRSPGATQNVAVMVFTVLSLKVFNKMPLEEKN